jgi:hypothetical protein
LWKSKKSFITFSCTGWPHGKEINFIFGLVYKVVMEVQTFFIFFTYMGAAYVHKTKVFSSNWINNLMNSLLSFHVILFFFVLLLLLLLCVIERWESFMLSASRTCILHEDLQKVSIFSLRTMPINGLCGQFCVRIVSMCQKWILFCFEWLNQLKRFILVLGCSFFF